MSPSFLPPRGRRVSPLLLFAPTIFLSAWLLFQVQPMFAKMALPLLGGAPAVWNTALVFFQAALLLGYLYAHLLGTLLRVRHQVIVHIAVLAVAFIVLPVAIGPAWRNPPDGMPVLWLIGLLAASVGLPFAALSANSPLLQRWFAESGHGMARDPYFLYAASNLGSLLALLAYPLAIEPRLTLGDQSEAWTVAYVLLAIAIGACGLAVVSKRRRGAAADTGAVERPHHRPLGAPNLRMRLHWIALSAVPSGLLVAATNFITTDLVAVPLLWIVPLVLYLLSFVLVFTARPPVSERWMRAIQVPLLVVSAIIATWSLAKYLYPAIALVLLTLFVTAMVCHRELMKRRPQARHLTEFYVWMSLGGILGSAFAALIAPLLFNLVLEFAILIAAAALLRPHTDATDEKRSDYPLAASALLREISVPAAGLALLALLSPRLDEGGSATAQLLFGLVLVFTAVFALLSHGRPLRFGLCVVALAAFGAQMSPNASAAVVHRERTFFGTHIVRRDATGQYLLLVHGSTIHGAQHVALNRRREPVTYYHAEAGIGRFFAALEAGNLRPQRVGAIGLGAGEIACYRQPGQDWTFFEIDPAVVRIAASGKLFRFVPDCAPRARMVIGDGRLTLAREPAGAFDLLVLDAFSSDSIPIHLATREALRLYLDKLAPGGTILFHISNRYLNLEPVLAGLADDAKISARVLIAREPKEDPDFPFRNTSYWVALSRDAARLTALTEGFDAARPSAWGKWRPLQRRESLRLWTDDYSNILSVLE